MEGHSRVPGNPAIPPTFPHQGRSSLLALLTPKADNCRFSAEFQPAMPALQPDAAIRTHFINSREMRSAQKGRWPRCAPCVWHHHTTRRAPCQRPFWAEPGGSGPFGRIAALRILVKTPSLDPNSRLALHPKRDSLALAPIYEMSSTLFMFDLGQEMPSDSGILCCLSCSAHLKSSHSIATCPPGTSYEPVLSLRSTFRIGQCRCSPVPVFVVDGCT